MSITFSILCWWKIVVCIKAFFILFDHYKLLQATSQAPSVLHWMLTELQAKILIYWTLTGASSCEVWVVLSTQRGPWYLHILHRNGSCQCKQIMPLIMFLESQSVNADQEDISFMMVAWAQAVSFWGSSTQQQSYDSYWMNACWKPVSAGTARWELLFVYSHVPSHKMLRLKLQNASIFYLQTIC